LASPEEWLEVFEVQRHVNFETTAGIVAEPMSSQTEVWVRQQQQQQAKKLCEYRLQHDKVSYRKAFDEAEE